MKLHITSATVATLAFALGSASAQTAYSNLGSGSNQYSSYAFPQGQGRYEAFEFTSALTGSLTGFQVAINSAYADGTPEGFELDLFANSSSDTLGTHLGTWYGTSTDLNFDTTNSALADVDASNSGIQLVAGQQYWLQGSAYFATAWNWSYAPSEEVMFNGGYLSNAPGAFSVQVQPAATPEPASLLALGLPAAGLLVRRRRLP